jgi:hypothetical protein
VLEPWLERVLDLSSLWIVDEGGALELVGLTRQVLRGAGVYLGCDIERTERGLVAGTAWDERVEDKARLLVEAAAAAGFRGPCGVDAFVYRDHQGELRLRGAVELNARFTAGYVALGLMKARGLPVGARAAFRLDRDDVLST